MNIEINRDYIVVKLSRNTMEIGYRGFVYMTRQIKFNEQYLLNVQRRENIDIVGASGKIKTITDYGIGFEVTNEDRA